MNAKQATFDILDNLPNGHEFQGAVLQNKVYHVTGAMHYPATMLRYMRQYRKENNCEIKCINKSRSIYKISRFTGELFDNMRTWGEQ